MTRQDHLYGLIETAVEAAIGRSERDLTDDEIDALRARFTRLYESPEPIGMSIYKR